MNDLKRISIVAVFLLVLLRISIGWQFVYEGMWKYSTLNSSNPWTAEGYLKSSQGPFRDYFRGLTGDPDDLNWLDYELMSQKWDTWQTDFVNHYGLDDQQRDELDQKLTRLLTGPSQHVAALEAIPESARETFETLNERAESRDVIQFDAENGRLVVSGQMPLQSSEAARLMASVDVVGVPGSINNLTPVYFRIGEDGGPLKNEEGELVPADPLEAEFYQAIERLERESAKLGFRQRLAALLEGDPDRVGVVRRLDERDRFVDVMGSIDSTEESPEAVNVNFGRIQQYRDELAAYEAALARARESNLAYEWDHVRTLGAKLSSLRTELVGPVRALEAEFKAAANALLKPEQIAQGPIPPDFDDPLHQAGGAALAGLLILGVLLILGLCTRLSAVLGAAMLIGFYLVLPPWPGVPQPPSPEHSFIVNKNLIEALALLGIAALPTGSWFGLDGLFRWLIRRGKSDGDGGSGKRDGPRVRRG